MKIDNTENKKVLGDMEYIDPEDIEKAKIINELKKKHRKLYVTNIAGEDIYWRPLKRSEYKEMLHLEFPEDMSEDDIVFEKETFIAERVIVYPENISEDIAIAAELITQMCLVKSGFDDRESFSFKEA